MKQDLFALMLAVALAAPFAIAGTTAGGVADENATWGLCTAKDASAQGNQSSNGTVHDTPPFQNITDEKCENTSAPWEGTPGEDHVPEDPGENGSDENRPDGR